MRNEYFGKKVTYLSYAKRIGMQHGFYVDEYPKSCMPSHEKTMKIARLHTKKSLALSIWSFAMQRHHILTSTYLI